MSCGSSVSTHPSTTLAAERGRRDAVMLQTAFLVDVAETCRQWRRVHVGGEANRRLIFAVDDQGGDAVLVDLASRARAHIERTTGVTAAERLRSVVDAEFARGARTVAVVGASSPSLPVHLLDHAFRALAWHRVVLGPTPEGGLWLCGMQRGTPVALPEAHWSLPQALALFSASLAETPHLLPFWYDVADAAAVERLLWHGHLLRRETPTAIAASWAALTTLGLVPRTRSSEPSGSARSR